MIQNNINIIGVMRTSRRLAVGCLLLFFMCGSMMAQNDTPFVIKKGDNYLAHVKIEEEYVLQSANTFNPSTCLWYSGPTYNPTGYTHNYYFEDDAHNLRFLAAPLYPDTTLSLSNSLPSVSMLRNTDQVYYFYNWDPETELNGVPEGGGVAKGHRYYVNTAEECHACGTPPGATWYETNTTNHTYQCWEVYWIEYSGSEWKLSNTSSYNITTNAARYRKVTVTEHEKEITAGGLTTLTVPSEMNFQENPLSSAVLSALVGSPYSYIPAYANYVFLENGSESVHNYWDTDHLNAIPAQVNNVTIGSTSYVWTISGDGQEFLSFSSSADVNTSTDGTPTLYYRVENTSGHKTATITVTVTYTDANNVQTTQTRSATVLVKTPCQNPSQTAIPVVTYTGVTVSWARTAESYKVFWKIETESNWNDSIEVGNVTSYTITGLEYETDYLYKVTTNCDNNDPTEYSFRTLPEPGLMVGGAIFGGGRMANVGGKTEVVIVNCDSIGAIYGGNDIAGEVEGGDGSIIKLGVNSGDAYASYGTTPNNGKIRVSSVYGGGNGYYTYDGYEPGIEIGTTVLTDRQFHSSVTEVGGGESYATSGVIPTISKTAIMVTNDKVKVDSIFGGAKNAFLTYNGTNAEPDGSLITINGGTIMAVFGGNNFGGKQGYGLHHIVVNGTTTCLTNSNGQPQAGTLGHQFGHDFGIGYLFGGGNKVYGSTTNIEIFGGQTDNVFGGGNSADVYAANVTVNCSLDAYSSNYTYGNTYTDAISTSYTSGAISIKNDYLWNGKGVYNVRNLYGGNNMEHMASVPIVTLTSGSVGTVYGGGNAGDMLASSAGSIDEDGDNTPDISFNYSTNVILNSANIIVDYLYGGCRMSNVDYSTWVQIQNGHVGTVFGGCNVSGDVGSTRVNPSAASGTAAYQEIQGGTYVEASGGTVYKNLFAGGNGFYHCNQNFHYVSGVNYTDENFVGMLVPSHNETYANVRTGATIKGNVYAGGNLAPVGFQDQVAPYFPSFPTDAVGWAVVHIYGGTVEGNVFGGGNMADVYGSNDVLVAGGTITALYGGNDRTGQVAEYSNRVLSPAYSYATDGSTMLVNPGPEVHAYVRVVGNPTIDEVYGGGNGDYDYENGDEVVSQYCDENESGPIQSNTFVDIHIDGGEHGGHIGTVYGGGDGVTASGFITVFMNIVEPNPAEDYVNVNTVFGGNNKGDLDIVPNIILLHGQVGTVYGGCNEGAMTAATGVDIGDYTNIGSYVRLRNEYRPNGTGTPVTPTAKVTEAVYGGCRMNGVNRNSLVLVEGGDFTNTLLFGGSDISGTVNGFSRVAVVDGTVGNVYGGGNGGYYYKEVTNSFGTYYQVYRDETMAQLLSDSVPAAPICAQSGADILGGSVGTSALLTAGTVAQVFGGGYGKDTQTTGDVIVNVGNKVPTLSGNNPVIPNIYGDIYGGSAFGNVNTNPSNTNPNPYTTTVNFFNGVLKKATVGTVDYGGNLFGGGLGRKDDLSTSGVDESIAAKVYGKVFVNISSEDQTETNCFIDLRDANIFGCNNTNGSPQDDVEVHVWKTAHTASDSSFYIGTTPSPLTYAINQVFGGGNQADYAPEDGATDSQKKTLVYVHNCSNTIHRVFSGGNAAAATGVSATIEGGRFDYVFGGGNGEVDPANIGLGGTNLVVSGGEINHLFGGSNQTGAITGETYTEINGGNASCMEQHITEFFGGSNMAEINSGGRVYSVVECGTGTIDEVYGGCNKAHITGNVILDIKGGTIPYVYGGSKGVAGEGGAANIDGNVTLNLMGGEITNAFGGSNINGNITGNITVNVVDYELTNCGLDLTNVYGGGNETPYTPGTNKCSVVNVIHIKQDDGIKGNVFGGAKGSTALVTANPIVNIGYDATSMSSYVTGLTVPDSPRAYVKGNVFGGGDAAPVNGSTTVNVYKGEIVHKLVGGGNEAGVSVNSGINVYGGSLCTTTEDNKGIYGGCNATGTVGGNVVMNIMGGSIGAIGNVANIHGGGYGQPTLVGGNVTVNFGEDNDIQNNYPMLYGDLYGGSALGNVNTNSSNTTTVTVYNGTIVGNVFGGGLGDNAALGAGHSNVEAKVFGKVYVKIGKWILPVAPATEPTFSGKATLYNCSVYGCNNVKGSPQDEVYVDVYNTYRRTTDEVNYLNSDVTYAIASVFGGGDKAHYAPTGSHRTHVYVHGCDNTAEFLYAGGNAADALGVEIVVEGGRFGEAYGGGNGMSVPANIGSGGINFNFHGGHYNYTYEGSNRWGENNGEVNTASLLPEGERVECGGAFIESHFFGANQAEIYVDVLENTITCAEAEDYHYTNVYAGSRWAIIYGDVKLTVEGGYIVNLYGGSQGYSGFSADIRRYPTAQEIAADVTIPHKYSDELRTFMQKHPERAGHGGNVTLVVNGGTIGNVFGGCNVRGNVEGKISVIVAENQTNCPLAVGNVYGASNHAFYDPMDNISNGTHYYYNSSYSNATSTPEVQIMKGTIGMSYDFDGEGPNPVMNFEGNVFGGANEGDIISNPIVVIGDAPSASPVTIKGDVYGGGNRGNVEGDPQVIIVPETAHTLTLETEGGGTIHATHIQGTSGTIGEGIELDIKAIPTAGNTFSSWEVVNGTGAIIHDPTRASTTFTMGTTNATIKAIFVAAKTLTITPSEYGTIDVTNSHGVAVNSGAVVGQGVTLNILATPKVATSSGGYVFSFWDVSGTEASLGNSSSASTTFTMGSADATLTANFNPTTDVHTLTLVSAQTGAGTFKVNDEEYANPVYVAETASVTVTAIAADGYVFSGWTVTNGTVSSLTTAITTFTMGSADATLTANFIVVPTLTLIANPTEKGTFKVNGTDYTNAVSLPVGGVLSIEATPVSGYVFNGWEITSGNGIITNASSATTTFTMGTQNTTIRANFVEETTPEP